MKPRRLLACVAAVFALPIVTIAPAQAADAKRPNIVVILSDDAGYNEFSMHGSKLYPTPRIDSIAADGARCTTGYVSGCVCSPSRAGLLTGRYQSRFGHERNIPPEVSEVNGLPIEEKTIADGLHGVGYRTIAVGKWHLGYAKKFHPLERGFTDYHGFLQGSRSYFPIAEMNPINRMMRNREYLPKEDFNYVTDELGRVTAEYIRETRDKPYFIYLAYNATHTPYQVLPEDLARIPDDKGHAKRRAMSLALDRSVGVVLDEIEKQGDANNTLVFFLNDNGGASGYDNSPLRGQKGTFWEGGVRVPFAVRWPGKVAKGTVYEKPVFSLDIFATALAAAEVSQPPGKPLDGVDLLPFLSGNNKAAPHDTLYWRSGSTWAIREGDLKLVQPAQGKPVELIDLASDPTEAKDLSVDRPDDVKRLQSKLQAWCKDFPATPWNSPSKQKAGNKAGNKAGRKAATELSASGE